MCIYISIYNILMLKNHGGIGGPTTFSKARNCWGEFNSAGALRKPGLREDRRAQRDGTDRVDVAGYVEDRLFC